MNSSTSIIELGLNGVNSLILVFSKQSTETEKKEMTKKGVQGSQSTSTSIPAHKDKLNYEQVASMSGSYNNMLFTLAKGHVRFGLNSEQTQRIEMLLDCFRKFCSSYDNLIKCIYCPTNRLADMSGSLNYMVYSDEGSVSNKFQHLKQGLRINSTRNLSTQNFFIFSLEQLIKLLYLHIKKCHTRFLHEVNKELQNHNVTPRENFPFNSRYERLLACWKELLSAHTGLEDYDDKVVALLTSLKTLASREYITTTSTRSSDGPETSRVTKVKSTPKFEKRSVGRTKKKSTGGKIETESLKSGEMEDVETEEREMVFDNAWRAHFNGGSTHLMRLDAKKRRHGIKTNFTTEEDPSDVVELGIAIDLMAIPSDSDDDEQSEGGEESGGEKKATKEPEWVDKVRKEVISDNNVVKVEYLDSEDAALIYLQGNMRKMSLDTKMWAKGMEDLCVDYFGCKIEFTLFNDKISIFDHVHKVHKIFDGNPKAPVALGLIRAIKYNDGNLAQILGDWHNKTDSMRIEYTYEGKSYRISGDKPLYDLMLELKDDLLTEGKKVFSSSEAIVFDSEPVIKGLGGGIDGMLELEMYMSDDRYNGNMTVYICGTKICRFTDVLNVNELVFELAARYGVYTSGLKVCKIREYNDFREIHVYFDVRLRGGMEETEQEMEKGRSITEDNTQPDRKMKVLQDNVDMSKTIKENDIITQFAKKIHIPAEWVSLAKNKLFRDGISAATSLLCNEMEKDEVFLTAMDRFWQSILEDTNHTIPDSRNNYIVLKTYRNKWETANMTDGTNAHNYILDTLTYKNTPHRYMNKEEQTIPLDPDLWPVWQIGTAPRNRDETERYMWDTKEYELITNIQIGNYQSPANISRSNTWFWDAANVISIITQLYGVNSFKTVSFSHIILKIFLYANMRLLIPDTSVEVWNIGYWSDYAQTTTADLFDEDYPLSPIHGANTIGAITMSVNDFFKWRTGAKGAPTPGWTADLLDIEIYAVPFNSTHMSNTGLNPWWVLCHAEYPYKVFSQQATDRPFSEVGPTISNRYTNQASHIRIRQGGTTKFIFVIMQAKDAGYFTNGGETVNLGGTPIVAWDGSGTVTPTNIHSVLDNAFVGNTIHKYYPSLIELWNGYYGAQEDVYDAMKQFAYHMTYDTVRNPCFYNILNEEGQMVSMKGYDAVNNVPSEYNQFGMFSNTMGNRPVQRVDITARWNAIGQQPYCRDQTIASKLADHTTLNITSSFIGIICATKTIMPVNRNKKDLSNYTIFERLITKGSQALHVALDHFKMARRLTYQDFYMGIDNSTQMRRIDREGNTMMYTHLIQQWTANLNPISYDRNIEVHNPFFTMTSLEGNFLACCSHFPEVIMRMFMGIEDVYKDANLMCNFDECDILTTEQQDAVLKFPHTSEEIFFMDLGRAYSVINSPAQSTRECWPADMHVWLEGKMNYETDPIAIEFIGPYTTMAMHRASDIATRTNPFIAVGTKGIQASMRTNSVAMGTSTRVKAHLALNVGEQSTQNFNAKNRYVGAIWRLTSVAYSSSDLKFKNTDLMGISSSFRTLFGKSGGTQ